MRDFENKHVITKLPGELTALALGRAMERASRRRRRDVRTPAATVFLLTESEQQAFRRAFQGAAATRNGGSFRYSYAVKACDFGGELLEDGVFHFNDNHLVDAGNPSYRSVLSIITTGARLLKDCRISNRSGREIGSITAAVEPGPHTLYLGSTEYRSIRIHSVFSGRAPTAECYVEQSRLNEAPMCTLYSDSSGRIVPVPVS